MADIISLLPDHVANQIAAGEVIQRPASVVKELLENAVDAGANEIQLLIKEAGKTMIQVIDNGIGMTITDVRLAFERHATSKIKSADDLFSINSKGFRGEALSSMAAIANIEIHTKTEEDDIGTCLKISGSKFGKQEVSVVPNGTSIAVKNLFFNVPARRNFLKSDKVELSHVIDEFYRVILSHPEIKFTFYQNGAELFSLAESNFRKRIANIFGNKI
jgi:DNA mismatch repair protein MutL